MRAQTKYCGIRKFPAVNIKHGPLGCDLVRWNVSFQTKSFYNEEYINLKT